MPIQDVGNVFVSGRVGRLMRIQENEQTRYQFEVWFEYTRQAMMHLKEGTLLSVKNFATNQDETHNSISEIVSIMPVHYALGENVEGYPGFVMEAARNIATDWTSQESQSNEDTTIIRCVAAPTGRELIESSSVTRLGQEQSIPMVGSDVRVFTSDATREIVNEEISPTQDLVFEGGRWLVDSAIPIYVRAEDFVRTHFGIFGFTGVGKSNLVSTVVSKLLEASRTNRRPVKMIIFDLMSEYSVLLLDQLVKTENAFLLAIDEFAFPNSVVRYLVGSAAEKENAINDLLNTTLYPKPLERVRESFRPAFSHLLDARKLRINQEPPRTLGEFLEENERILTKGQLGLSGSVINTFLENMYNIANRRVSEVAQGIYQAVDQLIRRGSRGEERREEPTLDSYGEERPEQRSDVQPLNLLAGVGVMERNLTQTAINNLRGFKHLLEGEARAAVRTYPPNASLSLDQIVNALNDPADSYLLVAQAHNSDDLRDFAYRLGRELFERRRSKGVISPLVSMIFDEADEFIPGEYKDDTSYARSAFIAEMLARRGRKFGIGVGICTQRTRYLKTSVMAQPHTYLVSRMPRITDRQAVQEAFGFSEDMFRQTFKFAPGDWLLASYDATGLKGVPIPIHAEDANQRIKTFLESLAREGNRASLFKPKRS